MSKTDAERLATLEEWRVAVDGDLHEVKSLLKTLIGGVAAGIVIIIVDISIRVTLNV